MGRRGLVALAVAAATLPVVVLASGAHRNVGSTRAEQAGPLPGDHLVPGATVVCTRAITIDAPPQRVWPWLAQLGQERAGFYTFTRLENLAGCEMPEVHELRPEWQQPQVGDAVHLAPTIALRIAALEPPLVYVLEGEPQPGVDMGFDFSWAFVCRPQGARTRLLVRERYHPHRAGAALAAHVGTLVSALMSWQMLRTIKGLAEG